MDKLQRAAAARTLLADAILQEAFSVLYSQQVMVFSGNNATPEQIMTAHHKLIALESVKAELASIITDGDMLARQEERERHRGND
jgi:hypothetical protein